MQKARTFHLGLGNISVKDKYTVKTELMTVLGINNNVSWTAHIYGRCIHTPADEMAIEQVFINHGLEKHEIWDNQPCR